MTVNSKIRLTQKDFSDISLSKNQLKYSQSILENTITVCWGSAGTSKTYTACYTALKLFSKGMVKKIILTKPIQESGEKLGSLPGDVNEKIAPFMDSFQSTLEKIIPKEKVTQLIREGIIEFRPLAYLRGSTFDECLIAGESILTEDGYVLVEELFEKAAKGEYVKVWSKNPKGELELQELDGISMSTTDKYVSVKLESGETISTTETHKFYTESGAIIEAINLKSGDILLTKEGSVKVSDAQSIDEKAVFFSVNVQENHNYFATHGLLSKNCLMILDEAQNCDMKQLMLYTSRLGKESKIVIAGDVTQHDIAYEKVALPDYINMIKDVKGVNEVRFTDEDIVRAEILKEIVRRYEEWKYRDMKPLNKKPSI